MPIDIAISPRTASERKLSGERVFFTALAASMLLAVLIGFGRTYYFRAFLPPQPAVLPPSALVHVHAALFSAWIVLFMVQVGFVAAGRRDLHMKLGLVGLPTVLAMIVVGTLTGLNLSKRLAGMPFDPFMMMALPLISMVGCSGLFLSALALRRTPGAHKRLMILGMAAMIGAAFARMPFIPFLIGAFFLPNIYTVALLAWDVVSDRRPHRATLAGGVVVLGATVGILFVWQNPLWLAFAKWASALVS
ncbi:hypothetical protein [Caulobacter sp.]|uniref:hypothetical protein n=1 Tax=Caulobacter sp. TaxID=78 RepID=UPI001B0EC519|nr:hypothetical protein [Caulobacter sp.]MBO9546449.1 hypothetical protein [Caulobacter sp.]